ncbi:DNA cytosine methyltransferase [Nostoc sp.]
MTTTTPNLGKLFTSRTSRPATPEDIKILQAGDWISERQCSWSWQFRNFCQDMTIGVWEGKEFFIPTNLLMVCEIIEGKVVEKFFKNPETPDLKTDSAEFFVGDRVQSKVDPQGLGYSGVVLEVNEKAQSASVRMEDGHTHTFYTEGLKHWKEPIKFKKGDRVCDTFPSSKGRIGTITKTSEQWSMVLWDGAQKSERWRHLEIAPKPTSGTDLGFKVGDRIISKHPLSLGQTFEIAEYPSVFADSSMSYEWLVTNTNLVLHVDQAYIISKPVLPADAPIAIILFAGGGGVEAGMVEAGIRPVIAVECDPKKPKLSSAIADNHDRNFGEYGCQVIRKTVQEISRLRFPVFPQNTDFLHASPMCSNFSIAKDGAIESPEDIAMASAVADAIHYLKPKFFTLENVKLYSESQSFQIIASCLEEEGYIWHGEVLTLLDCQARERFIVRAAKDWLPPMSKPIQPVGWYEVISDLIPKMPDSELVPGQQKSLEEFLSKNEPTPLLIGRTGARGEYRVKPAHLPCSTIVRSHFTDGKGHNRNKFADIWLPSGAVKSLSIEAAARLQGFPDWYEFPPDTATAGSIIGYSVPPKFAAQLFKSLQQPPPIEVQIQMCQERIIKHNWHIQNLDVLPQTKDTKEAIEKALGAISSEQEHINQLLEELIIYRQFIALGCEQHQARVEALKLLQRG